MGSKQSLISQVSAVSPLRKAIDGSERPKARRQSAERRKPLDRQDRFFCSNKNCDHETFSAEDQAKHMAGEFWKVVKTLVRLAPESLEALKLTGGVILTDLTADQCRDACAEVDRFRRRGEKVPLQVRLRYNEYMRRMAAGTMPIRTKEEIQARYRARHPGKPERIVQPRRRDTADLAARAERQAALPPLAERRSRRIALGLTHHELGAKIGANGASILRWETGRTVPHSLDALNAYVQLLASADLEKVDSSVRSVKDAARHRAWPPAKVRTVRTDLGLSQVQFAKRLGVNPATARRWEIGQTIPTAAGIAHLDALVGERPTSADPAPPAR
jgi:DNA-binding transcriptional regulator YiaG